MTGLEILGVVMEGILPREAIQKAINGGWSNWVDSKTMKYNCDIDLYEHALLDPFFWQALAKELKIYSNSPINFFGRGIARKYFNLLLKNPTKEKLSDFWGQLLKDTT